MTENTYSSQAPESVLRIVIRFDLRDILRQYLGLFYFKTYLKMDRSVEAFIGLSIRIFIKEHSNINGRRLSYFHIQNNSVVPFL